MNDLTETAQNWGVDLHYYDVFGKRYEASPETLTQLVDAMSASGKMPRPAERTHGGAPRAYQGNGQRAWVLGVQLYAVRSRRNWGHGDFTDLKRLIALAAARGASGVGLNPLHALFADRAEEASPYAPNSRIFLNALYIDVEAIPEFPGLAVAGLGAEIEALRATELVAYGRVAALKMDALRLAYACFREHAQVTRRREFNAWRAAQGEALLRFSCFEVLRRQQAPRPWTEWPRPWRAPTCAELDEFRRTHEADCELHEFIQWVADSQLGDCAAEAHWLGMPIGLYTDLAVGIDRHGADAWSEQDAVLATVSMGAPPDDFNPGGQDWGLAPFNPHVLPADDFASMRRLMSAAMRHAGAVRLDHVLGLKRVYMVPLGQAAANGAYVQFPFEPLLHVVAEESNRGRCIVIGEDLGTVPENFRETIARWGLWSYRLMLFEREWDGRFRPPEAYPAEALATFSTHDLPTFHGWIARHDLAVKRGIGVDPGENDDVRAWALVKLREILSERGGGYPPDDITAVAAFLAATTSRLVLIALDDVVGMLDQVNIPGTVTQHPNWRRKLPVELEGLETHDGLRRVGEVFAKAGRSFK